MCACVCSSLSRCQMEPLKCYGLSINSSRCCFQPPCVCSGVAGCLSSWCCRGRLLSCFPVERRWASPAAPPPSIIPVSTDKCTPLCLITSSLVLQNIENTPLCTRTCASLCIFCFSDGMNICVCVLQGFRSVYGHDYPRGDAALPLC